MLKKKKSIQMAATADKQTTGKLKIDKKSNFAASFFSLPGVSNNIMLIIDGIKLATPSNNKIREEIICAVIL